MSPLRVRGKDILEVVVVSDVVGQKTSSVEFQAVANAEADVTVPRGRQGLLLARFSGESTCAGTPRGSGRVRILVNGQEAEPATGEGLMFDSVTEYELHQCHSIDRSLGPLEPGSYSVQVQWRVSDPGVTMGIDDWALTVELVSV